MCGDKMAIAQTLIFNTVTVSAFCVRASAFAFPCYAQDVIPFHEITDRNRFLCNSASGRRAKSRRYLHIRIIFKVKWYKSFRFYISVLRASCKSFCFLCKSFRFCISVLRARCKSFCFLCKSFRFYISVLRTRCSNFHVHVKNNRLVLCHVWLSIFRYIAD